MVMQVLILILLFGMLAAVLYGLYKSRKDD